MNPGGCSWLNARTSLNKAPSHERERARPPRVAATSPGVLIYSNVHGLLRFYLLAACQVPPLDLDGGFILCAPYTLDKAVASSRAGQARPSLSQIASTTWNNMVSLGDVHEPHHELLTSRHLCGVAPWLWLACPPVRRRRRTGSLPFQRSSGQPVTCTPIATAGRAASASARTTRCDAPRGRGG